MHRKHVVATAIATVALAAPSTAMTTAVAAGDHAPKSQTKQLLKDLAGKDRRLARLVGSNAVVRLGDDTEAELVANLGDARAQLATVKAAAEAADSSVDTRAVRHDLHSFRVENFRIVVNVLRQAESLSGAAATDPEAQSHLDLARAAALAITANSTKADIRTAREHLHEARTELASAAPAA